MHHFFADQKDIYEQEIYLTGENYKHAARVLRLREGETILISGPDGTDYRCTVAEVSTEEAGVGIGKRHRKAMEADTLLPGSVSGRSGTPGRSVPEGPWLRASVEEILAVNHELPAEVVLFQCLPKSDKLELIIQKAVELGVTAIVPVNSKNCVAKLDEKKAETKVRRWQAIAESAARQSKRSVIPAVHAPVTLKEAFDMTDGFDVRLIPYEEENGLTSLCEAIISFLPGSRIAVFIGPEGGFDPMEVTMARRHGVVPVSLGKRILRTETAAIAMLSLIMIRLEIAAGLDLTAEET